MSGEPSAAPAASPPPAPTPQTPVAAATATPFLTVRRLLWLVGIACVLVLLVLFVADNFVLVQIRVFTLRVQTRLAWALIVPLLLGGVIGWGGHALVARQRARS